MGSIFIKQPNGLFCRFSTITDCPTCCNFTAEDVKKYLMAQYEAEVDSRIEKLKNGKNLWHWEWEDVLQHSEIGIENGNMSRFGFEEFVRRATTPVEIPDTTPLPTPSITKEEALSRLKEINENGNLDQEADHIDADNVLMEFLTGLGYADVVKEFNRIPKWYA